VSPRPVRLAEAALVDIARQLDEVTALRFARADLLEALDRLADGWDWLPEFGPGRRLTLDGVTVAGFHLFADLDDAGTIVVYAIDIWPDRWPTE
jgi:hypothetical protein